MKTLKLQFDEGADTLQNQVVAQGYQIRNIAALRTAQHHIKAINRLHAYDMLSAREAARLHKRIEKQIEYWIWRKE